MKTFRFAVILLTCGGCALLDMPRDHEEECRDACAKVRQCGLSELEPLFCNPDDSSCSRVPFDECPLCVADSSCEAIAERRPFCKEVCVFMQR